MTLATELRRVVGDSAVLEPAPAQYLVDETEGRGVRGRADAVVLPGSAEEVAGVVRWCYANDVPIVPRSGGTGYAAAPSRSRAVSSWRSTASGACACTRR